MSKSKQERRPHALYEKLIAQREREGLTYRELSMRSGVPLATLQEWSRRLREEPASSQAPFVELAPSSPSAPVEIVLRGGHRLELATAHPPTGLADLVAALKAC